MTPRFALTYFIPPSMEEDRPTLGEGLSRPSPDEQTRLFTAMIRCPGEQPMKTTIRAASAAKAKLYAKNRWPTATCEILK
jgi:hypothetical protein